LRILVVAPDYRLLSGPAHSLLFIKELVKNNFEIHLFFSDLINAIHVRKFGIKPFVLTERLTHYQLSKYIQKIHEKYSYDYILSISPEYLLNLNERVLSKTMVIPQGRCSIFSIIEKLKEGPLALRILPSLMESFSISKKIGAFGAISRYMYREIIQNVRTNRVALIYNPVDYLFFKEGKESFYQQSGRDPLAKLKLLYVGNLTSLKGVNKLIEFMPAIIREFRTARLDIVGEGPLKNKLSNMIRRLNLLGRVRLYGCLRPAELAKLYRNSTLFITASYRESFCLPVAEAAATGTPSVVRGVYALRDHVEFGYATAFLNDVDDEVVDSIGRALDNYEKLATRGLKVSERLYLPTKVAKRVLRTLESFS